MRFNTIAFATLVGLAAARNAVKKPGHADGQVPADAIRTDLDVDELKIEKLEEVPVADCKFKTGPGSVVITLYNGKLLNGKVIDMSWDNNDPHQFQIGTPLVIDGLQDGVGDMCVGEVRRITIPSRLGHGNKVSGGGLIPAGAAIEYTLKLIGLKPPMYANAEYIAYSQAQQAAQSTETSAAAEPSETAEHVRDEL
ncbi:hypothetical protein H072_2131 [Dactylellina haptotyla CBS 200.50]|uniref:peptidylprolyl isomerase n=1 Tax=Dactylellina haptotyla (strain CBS 200.50) TaxID=1284197 RepID=S8BWW2_DACHA|nr:hypothetical protein H072_2131 [Dactylellina haptotyla CBS 200.50]